MAWTAPRTWVTAEIITAALFNTHIRDTFLAADQHGHDGSAGDGGTSLGSLVKETFTDAAAPAAPGAAKTAVYAVSGRPHYRAGAGGSDTQLADAGDLHNENHASRHQPAGADAMAVDAVAGTGGLRTLGTGAQQGAVGSHTHTPSSNNTTKGADNNGAQSYTNTAMRNDTAFTAITATISRTPDAANRAHFCVGVYWGTNSTAGQTDFRLMYDAVQKASASHAASTNLEPGRSLTHLEADPSVASHSLVLEGKVADTADRIIGPQIIIEEIKV